ADAAGISRGDRACQAGEPRALAAARRSAASPQTCADGQPDAIAILIRRTLLVTIAPTLSSLRRIVPHVTSANSVWLKAMRRKAHISTYAIEANHSRSWLPRIVCVEVRSANRSAWHSLIRFSMSPRAQ